VTDADGADTGGETLTPKAARARYLADLYLSGDAVSERQWYRWIEEGLVPSVTLPSGRRRVRVADLERLIRAGGVT
jgi:hypothetical protein